MLPDPYPRALSFPLNTPDLLFPMNIPAWSLFFELVANLIFAATWRRLSTRGLVPLVVAAGIGLMLAVNFKWLGFGVLPERFSAGAIWASAWGGLARVMFSFFAGVLVFRLWRRFPPRRSAPPLVFIGGLFVILAYNPPPEFEIVYALLAALFVFPALVFFGASSVPAKPNARLFTWMGNISYGVYVLQQSYYVLVMALVAACTGHEFAGLPAFGLLAMFALLAPLATLTHRYFDVPVRRILIDLLDTANVFKMVRARARFG
jgi:peptidoglycan/LPS O-acetylase OafA/YrhL